MTYDHSPNDDEEHQQATAASMMYSTPSHQHQHPHPSHHDMLAWSAESQLSAMNYYNTLLPPPPELPSPPLPMISTAASNYTTASAPMELGISQLQAVVSSSNNASSTSDDNTVTSPTSSLPSPTAALTAHAVVPMRCGAHTNDTSSNSKASTGDNDHHADRANATSTTATPLATPPAIISTQTRTHISTNPALAPPPPLLDPSKQYHPEWGVIKDQDFHPLTLKHQRDLENLFNNGNVIPDFYFWQANLGGYCMADMLQGIVVSSEGAFVLERKIVEGAPHPGRKKKKNGLG